MKRSASVSVVLFLAVLVYAASETSPIFRDLASRFLDPIRTNAFYPIPAVAIYQGNLCSDECQVIREEFRVYLAAPGRLPALVGHLTLKWEWHVGQGSKNNLQYIYVLAYDRSTLRVWQTSFLVDSDHEAILFKKAVILMESKGNVIPDGFEVFQLHPAPD